MRIIVEAKDFQDHIKQHTNRADNQINANFDSTDKESIPSELEGVVEIAAFKNQVSRQTNLKSSTLTKNSEHSVEPITSNYKDEKPDANSKLNININDADEEEKEDGLVQM